MKQMKRIVSLSLTLLLLLGTLPMAATAANPWAYVVTKDGKRTDYSSFPAAWNAAVKYDEATVGLYDNWESGRFVVPNKKKITLEMNGYWVSRNLGESEDKGEGEVFRVGEYATLTVYGGNKADPAYRSDAEHNMAVYVPRENNKPERKKVKLYGGIIHGGNSDNGGGGIYMEEGARVNLYHVTVAGNQADNQGLLYGDGGGVYMNDDYGYLYMEDSSICYNFAEWDGGGVFVDTYAPYCTVEMVRSHIEHNSCDDNGGGIHVDADHFTLIGDAKQIVASEDELKALMGNVPGWDKTNGNYDKARDLGSSVSWNYVYDCQDGGGGLCLANNYALVEGVNFIGNNADNAKGDGGGIYILKENVTVRDCNFFRNRADDLGGGIRNGNDKNTIDSCTLFWNIARATGGAGGGIYTYSSNDLAIAGSLIVCGNSSASYGADNLYLSGAGATNAYVIPSLSPGANVHIRLGSGHNERVSTVGTFKGNWFSYDNGNTKHIGWDNGKRYLRLFDGPKPVRVVETFTPDTGKRIKTLAETYNGYPLIKGVFSYPSFPDETADIESIFYYSDGFFMGSAEDYNEHLATASLCLAAAAGYSNLYGKTYDGSKLAQHNDYLDKSKNFRQFVSDIGCADEDIFVNYYNMQKPEADTIGVGIASKVLESGETLVIIGVRGMGYEAEWISNMTLGTQSEAWGWSSAAGQVMAELKDYLARKGIDGASENTKFWIAGYSRAGATANLTAKRIVDTYDPKGARTFAYPLEAPKGGVESAKVSGSNYNCIHNVVNQNDIVPWVGTTEMGFIRYGVDHYVPGSVTTNAGNTAWNVGSGSYNKQKDLFVRQLSAVNTDISFDDYYHSATVKYITTGDRITETSDHSDWTTEKFIKEFFEYFQKTALSYDSDRRKAYAGTAVTSNKRTFQTAARTVAGLLFGKSQEEVRQITKCFAGALERLSESYSDLFSIYMRLNPAVGSPVSWFVDLQKKEDWRGISEMIWKYLTDVSADDRLKGYRSLSDCLSKEELSDLHTCFDALLVPVFYFVYQDYDKYDQDLLGTLAYNIPRIIANHYPEVTHAWLRSYDSFYQNDTTAVTMDASARRGPSPVAVEIIGAGGETRIISGNALTEVIEVGLNETVCLVPADTADRDAGEAIYYQFTSGKSYVQNVHAFSDPFRLKNMLDAYATDGVFTLMAVAAHNGQKLDPVTITLKMEKDAIYSIPGKGGTNTEVPLSVGQSLDLQFYGPEDDGLYLFKEWKVYSYDNGKRGDPISSDKYVAYFGPDFYAKSETTTVRNLAGVSARFEPSYDTVIDDITIGFYGEADGGGLPSMIDCYVLGDPLDMGCPIAWDYRVDADTAPYYIGSFSITLPDGKTLAALENMEIKLTGFEKYRLQKPVVESLVVSGRRARFDVRIAPQGQESGAPAALQSATLPAGTSKLAGETQPLTAPLLSEISLRTAPEGPIEGYKATVYVRDLNLNQIVGQYTFYSDTSPVSVSAPAMEDMEFMLWGDDHPNREPVRTLGDGGELEAWYYPVVNQFEVTLARPLTVGEALPNLDSMTVTVSNVWRIDSASLEWVDAGGAAAYDTAYTARIRILDADGKLAGTNLNDPISGSQMLSGAVAFAPTSDVVVKDKNGTEYNAAAYLLDDSLWIVFEKTPKPKIVAFAPVSVVVPSGSTREDILNALPDTAYAYLEDGRLIQVCAQWNKTGFINAASEEQQDISAYGAPQTALLETYDVSDSIILTADVAVPAAKQTAAPSATPSGGDCPAERKIRLTADEGTTIRYALTVTDGAFPENTETLSYQTYTEPFPLNQQGKNVYLFAYAEKDGFARSSTVWYVYHLSGEPTPTPDPGYTPSGGAAEPKETRFDVVDPAKGGNMGNFKAADTYKDGTFVDVAPDDWFAENVRAAVNYGLLLGRGDGVYGVGEKLKVSEALAIVCRLHNIYYGGSGVLDQTKDAVWYQVYADYAERYDFFQKGLDLNAPITRGQFAAIISAALPDAALKPINAVTQIPDVAKDDPNYAAIARLYNAGILTGVDEQGTFLPDAPITREQIAAIATRVADPSLQKTVTL